MKEKFLVLLYLATVFYLSSCHNPFIMVFIILFLTAVSYTEAPRLLKKAALSTIVLNSMVTAGYLAFRKPDWVSFILTFNLRVFAITFLTLLTTDKVNIFRALSFSKTASTLLTIAYSQILLFANILKDFKLAFRSRTIQKPAKKEIHNFISSTSYFFLNRALNSSVEMAQAMRSRGFFND